MGLRAYCFYLSRKHLVDDSWSLLLRIDSGLLKGMNNVPSHLLLFWGMTTTSTAGWSNRTEESCRSVLEPVSECCPLSASSVSFFSSSPPGCNGGSGGWWVVCSGLTWELAWLEFPDELKWPCKYRVYVNTVTQGLCFEKYVPSCCFNIN